MRVDVDLHQRVARFAAAEPGMPLAAQPQRLAVLQPRGDRDIQRLAISHHDALLGPVDGFREFHRHGVADVRALGFGAATAPAEYLGEQVLLVVGPRPLPAALIPGAGAGLGVLAVELALGLLPLGAGCVYLAGVESGTLLLVANDIVSGCDLLEAGFRPLVAGMQVRVVLLGEPAIGLADLLLRRRTADAQDLIWVRHRLGPRGAFADAQP